MGAFFSDEESERVFENIAKKYEFSNVVYFVLEVGEDIDPYRVSTFFGYFLFEYKFKNILKKASIPTPKA